MLIFYYVVCKVLAVISDGPLSESGIVCITEKPRAPAASTCQWKIPRLTGSLEVEGVSLLRFAVTNLLPIIIIG